jgi:divalent metal cation (Fe/Co/Zn/Cd) transporter
MNVAGVLSVVDLRARKSGPFLYVEATIGVAGGITASAAHRLAELVKSELLLKNPDRVTGVVVHSEPLGAVGLGEKGGISNGGEEDYKKSVTEALKVLPSILRVADIYLFFKDDGRLTLKVDVVMHDALSIRQAHAEAVKARAIIMSSLPGVADVDVDLELDEKIGS